MMTATRQSTRAFGHGSRPLLSIALACLAVVVVVSAGVLSTGSTGSPPSSSRPGVTASAARRSPATYGQIPSWLPKPKVRVGRTAVATAAHPWLAIEGDTVSVRLAHGRVLATAVGPAVPHEGQFPVPVSTPCAFTITFTAAAGAVPLDSNAFTIVDEYGHLHHPLVRGTRTGLLPRQVAPGRTVSLTVGDVLPTGNGRLSWAPDGVKPVVSWDFEVEID